MEITGRITKDAVVNQVANEREVVNFSIAINDSYKIKNSNEIKKVTTYFNCAYWVSNSIAKYLTKGTLVELYGRVGVNAYVSSQGEPKASITFHVNNIKLLGRAKYSEAMADTNEPVQPTNTSEPSDDLPF